MIVHAVLLRNARRENAAHTLRYLETGTDHRRRHERVLFELSSPDLPSDRSLALSVMQTTRPSRSYKTSQFLHLIMSLTPGEHASRQQWQDMAVTALQHLGLEDHQYLGTAHLDTSCEHLHLLVNTFHAGPDGRCRKHNLSFLKLRCMQAGDLLERKFSLVPTPHRLKHSKARSTGQSIAAVRGERSFAAWCADLGPDLQGCDSWQQLHAVLQEHGLRLSPHGQGAVITDLKQQHHLKSSAIHPSLSLPQLTTRLGPWQEPPADLPPPKRSFTPGPSTDLITVPENLSSSARGLRDQLRHSTDARAQLLLQSRRPIVYGGNVIHAPLKAGQGFDGHLTGHGELLLTTRHGGPPLRCNGQVTQVPDQLPRQVLHQALRRMAQAVTHPLRISGPRVFQRLCSDICLLLRIQADFADPGIQRHFEETAHVRSQRRYPRRRRRRPASTHRQIRHHIPYLADHPGLRAGRPAAPAVSETAAQAARTDMLPLPGGDLVRTQWPAHLLLQQNGEHALDLRHAQQSAAVRRPAAGSGSGGRRDLTADGDQNVNQLSPPSSADTPAQAQSDHPTTTPADQTPAATDGAQLQQAARRSVKSLLEYLQDRNARHAQGLKDVPEHRPFGQQSGTFDFVGIRRLQEGSYAVLGRDGINYLRQLTPEELNRLKGEKRHTQIKATATTIRRR